MLTQRIASAVIGVPLVFVLIYLGGVWYVAAAAAALSVAALEFQHMQRGWFDPVSLLSAALVGGIAVGAYAGTTEWLAWIVAAVLLAPLATLARPTQAGGRVMDLLWALLGVSYVGMLGSFIVLLRYIDFDARSWVFLAVISTFATDTGAYFTGRIFGRHLLAPRISPKKTAEGFAGGYIAGFPAVIICNYAFDIGVTAPQIIGLALLLPPAAALGDLIESAIKRSMDVKDASELIPGHGGVLDRLDSVLLTFAVTYLFTQWVAY
ncbi:MAG: phosphatidate cytidylyltransferase [Chloroflexota bacterium]|nr:phosphatidate cytidylyltransferase [Chloroflexota bacterium]